MARSIVGAGLDIGGSLASIGARGIGLFDEYTGLDASKEADSINRFKSELGELATEKDIDEGYSPIDIAGVKVNPGALIRGALSSAGKAYMVGPLGAKGVSAAFGADQWNQSLTEGKDAGLEGAELHTYAASQGILEAELPCCSLKPVAVAWRQ